MKLLDNYLNTKGYDSFTEFIEIILDKDEKIYRFKPDIFILSKDKLNIVGQSIADCGVLEYCLVYQDGSIEQLRLEEGMYRVINIQINNLNMRFIK